jgi:hypothetical protein
MYFIFEKGLKQFKHQRPAVVNTDGFKTEAL